MQTSHQQEIRAILTELQKRCPEGAICKNLFTCLTRGQWDQMGRCCELRLKGLQNSSDLYAKGAVHMQLGAVYEMKNAPDQALPHYEDAVQLFRICDGRIAGLAQVALGMVYGSIAQMEKASQSYQEGIELLSSLKDPLAETIRIWQSELGQLLERHREKALSHWKEGDIYKVQGKRPEAQDAYNKALVLFQRLDDNSAISAIKAKLQEINQQDAQAQTQESAGARPTPQVYHKIRLIPLCEGRVAAGTPVIALGRINKYVTTDTLCIEDREFYLREIWSVRGEPHVDSFGFAFLVTGRSMEPAIHNGDCVLVRKVDVEKGDIVIARVPGSTGEDEFTVKRFHPEKDHIRLSPDNKEEKTIIIVETEEMGEIVKDCYPDLAPSDRLLIIVGPESLIEGKVVAVLSPKS